MESGSTEVLCCFYYWMQNNVQIYERSYPKLTETLSQIGGIYQIILTWRI